MSQNQDLILVTGSSGHIGNVLVRELHKRGKQILILTKTGKKPACLDHLDIVVCQGDIKDAKAVDNAVKKADIVFHLAGIVSISSFDSDQLTKVNVQGTQNVVDACLKHGVKRLVFTSSVHAIPEGDKEQPITEKNDFEVEELFGAYSRTKALATISVLKAVEEGLDAVICYPTGVMGPYDFRGSEAGRLIRDYATNKIPVYIAGEYNFVDVRDVVQGHLLALEKGRAGEGYILAGERMTLNQFFDILSGFEPKMRKPKFRLPLSIAIASAWLLERICLLVGTKPLFTVYAIKILQSNCNISSEKAKQELTYTARPIKESIRDSLIWLKENHKI